MGTICDKSQPTQYVTDTPSDEEATSIYKERRLLQAQEPPASTQVVTEDVWKPPPRKDYMAIKHSVVDELIS